MLLRESPNSSTPKQFKAYDKAKDSMLGRYYIQHKTEVRLVVGILAVLLAVKGITSLFRNNDYLLRETEDLHDRSHAVTWNVAAINNNPFEYWITNDDPAYYDLMRSVSGRIVAPTVKEDRMVKDVFTMDMLEELLEKLRATGWDGVEETKFRFSNDFAKRRVYSDFLTDPILGKKRLISMTDRVTNTIQLVDGNTATRPTVINCYENADLGSVAEWWTKWKNFMFDHSYAVMKGGENKVLKVPDMIQPIKKSKYPALSAEEEKISKPLQILCAAIFDAILVDMMASIAPKKWQPMRQDICAKLNKNKIQRTAEILETSYSRSDFVFLQEVAGNFGDKAKNRPLLKKFFDMHQPSLAPGTERDQLSYILLQKGAFEDVVDVTDDVMQILQTMSTTSGKPAPVAPGDLLVITAVKKLSGQKYLLASFHGDTNGLATIPITTAVHKYSTEKKPNHKLLFGMDANTYTNPESDQQGVVEFAEYYSSEGLTSSWGTKPDPINFTTFHARTHLQSQLNKAVALEDKDKKGDKNPKDFILFKENDFTLLQSTKDNTGARRYIENMVFPTLDFPSDHGITSSVLLDRPKDAAGGLRGQVDRK